MKIIKNLPYDIVVFLSMLFLFISIHLFFHLSYRDSWRAWSDYHAKRYQKAYHDFSEMKGADAYYNQGNALAHLGHEQAARYAYQKALHLKPHYRDAMFNWSLLKHLQGQSSAATRQFHPNFSTSSSVSLNERHLADQQWLDRVSDDPGGLLRRKLLRDYLRRLQK